MYRALSLSMDRKAVSSAHGLFHALVDAEGLAMRGVVQSADVQDRGGRPSF
jgi:hypothetical protein